MDRLRVVEYGDRHEVPFRMFGVLFGAFFLYAYNGWTLAFIWAGLFLSLHVVFWSFLSRERALVTPVHLTLANLLFLSVLLAFLWLPAFLASQTDATLSFAGTTLIVATVAFLIRRADTTLWLVYAQIGAVIAAILFVVLQKLDRMNGTMGVFSSLVVTLAVCLYLTQAILIARRTRLKAEGAAERVAQEQKMAAVGRLAGGVAHDINNALTAVIGNLELNRLVRDSGEREEAVESAWIAAKRAETMVRHLLILARKAPAQLRPVEISTGVRRALELSRRLIPGDVVQVLVLKDDTPLVRVDEDQLVTALINLLTNAVDVMPGGGELRIETARREVKTAMLQIDGSEIDIGDYVTVSISDTGPGIPPHHLPKVIEPFFSTKATGQGTGLGLPMVLGFAQEAKGGLVIASGRRGTSATIYLPALEPGLADDLLPLKASFNKSGPQSAA